MKKFLLLVALVGIGGAAYLIGSALWSSPERREKQVIHIPTPKGVIPKKKLVQSTPTGSTEKPFAQFPVGKTRPVDFLMDEATRSRLTQREQKDQLRDWLLYTVISNSGLSADDTNRVLFDVPTVRHGHMRSVAHFEYGVTRSCYIGEDQVVALVPKCSEEERKDYLAHIADDHRKSQGHKPKTLIFFEYELDFNTFKGTLTRRENLTGEQLFTSQYGYHEQSIGGLADLKEFMARVQDVTYVSRDNGFKLGGRTLLARKYRGIRVEDVAAVWQAQNKIKYKLDSFEREYERAVERVRARWQRKLNALNASRRRRPGGFPGIFPFPPPEDENLQQLLERLRRNRLGRGRPPGGMPGFRGTYEQQAAALQKGFNEEAKEVAAKFAKRRRKEGLVDHTGFSLDPKYDYEALKKWYQDKGRKSLGLFVNLKAITRAEVEAVGAGLEKEDEGPLLAVLHKLKQRGGFVGLLAEQLNRKQRGFRFQIARYDGDLQGTEVGMILFYTDLLAKLWSSVDYNAPKDVIEDFRTSAEGGTAPIYRQEIVDNPSTRLWFGPEDRGYHIVDGRKGMLFARRATRIFAASSNPLLPGKEIPASYNAERVIGWWNDHYEELARHEQEYERLNEYMKWSLIIGWLYSQDDQETLAFLQQVRVDRSAWFSEWIRKHPELRYKQWEKVKFHPRGYKGTTTEAIPILKSRLFRDFGEEKAIWTVSGGVSGGRPRILKTRPVLPKTIQPGSKLRLSLRGMDLKNMPSRGGKIRTLGGTTHSFKGVGTTRATMRIEPSATRALRSEHGHLARTNFERLVYRSGKQVGFEVQAGKRKLGKLTVEARGNGFEVRHTSREMDAGLDLVRDLSSHKGSPAEGLARDARVEAVLQTGKDTFLVKMRNHPNWMKIAPETRPTSKVPKGWDSRVADTSVGSKIYKVAFVDSKTVVREMGNGTTLRVELKPMLDQRPGIPVLGRGPPGKGGPPTGGRPIDIVHGSNRIPGKFDPNGKVIFIDRSRLPRDLANRPEALVKLVGSADPHALVAQARQPGTKLSIGSGEAVSTSKHPLIDALETGQASKAARYFAENPLEARKILDADLPGRLEYADRLLAQGRPAEALDVLRIAQKVHGSHPHLRLRQGLALLKLRRAPTAARLLRRSARSRGRPQSLLDEINRRLKQPGLSPQEHGALIRKAKLEIHRDIAVKGNTNAEVKLVADKDGQLHLETTLPEARLDPAKPRSLKPGDEVLLDDAAGLHNRDWSPGNRQKTLQQEVEAGEVELFALHKPDQALTLQTDTVVLRNKQTRTRWARSTRPRTRQVRIRHRWRRFRRQEEKPEEELELLLEEVTIPEPISQGALLRHRALNMVSALATTWVPTGQPWTTVGWAKGRSMLHPEPRPEPPQTITRTRNSRMRVLVVLKRKK